MAVKANNDMATEKVNTSEKSKALDLAISQLEKRFGKGSVMKLGENTAVPIAVIPTGSLSLDLALGVGGIPKGRITEIYGPESSGKTTLAQHIVAEAQKQGGTASYIDVENALDRAYAATCGVKTEELYISQPDTGEQALEITEALVRSGAVDIIVVDSVAALVPQAEIEGEMGDAHVGLQARLMSQALRKLAAAISKSNTVVVFINQLREKVGIVYGNPEVTPGGRALKFYSSVRIDLRRTETIMQGTEAVGNHVKAKIVKNKVAPPFRTAEFDIMFAHGISKEGDLIELGVQRGLINKAGAFFSYGDVRLGQGRENAKTYLIQNPELAREIEQKIRASAAAVSSTPTAGENAD
jgi:recombination protein RecA